MKTNRWAVLAALISASSVAQAETYADSVSNATVATVGLTNVPTNSFAVAQGVSVAVAVVEGFEVNGASNLGDIAFINNTIQHSIVDTDIEGHGLAAAITGLDGQVISFDIKDNLP